MREDVKAAQEQQRAAVSNAEIALERDLPTLELFGSLSLNGFATPVGGKPGTLPDAIAQSFSFAQPTEAVGIRFSAPIDFGVLGRTRQGWRLERDAAELTYQRKLFEQDQGWKDLTDRLAQARHRFTLSRAVETTQEAKLNHEKTRLQQGRTTTFQVLAFEQDYASSVLTRVQAEAEVLTLLAQMKLYGEAQ
jgi:outer membrane protein TolC